MIYKINILTEEQNKDKLYFDLAQRISKQFGVTVEVYKEESENELIAGESFAKKRKTLIHVSNPE